MVCTIFYSCWYVLYVYYKPSLFFVIIGETARNFFDRVKRRYLKRRLELKKVDKSGASSAVVDKARRKLSAYSFLFWLDTYLNPRRTRCNIPDNISYISTGCDDEESCDENVQKDEVARQEFDEVEPVDEISNKKRKPETKAKKAKKMKNETISLEEKQMSILNRIDSELKEDEDNKLKDKEYLYGQSIAAEICNFVKAGRCMIKHEINNIIFKY